MPALTEPAARSRWRCGGAERRGRRRLLLRDGAGSRRGQEQRKVGNILRVTQAKRVPFRKHFFRRLHIICEVKPHVPLEEITSHLGEDHAGMNGVDAYFIAKITTLFGGRFRHQSNGPFCTAVGTETGKPDHAGNR